MLAGEGLLVPFVAEDDSGIALDQVELDLFIEAVWGLEADEPRRGRRTGFSQHVAQRHAGPQRRADERTADLVGDAGQRDELFDRLEP